MYEEGFHGPFEQSPRDRFLKELVRLGQQAMPLLKFRAVGPGHHYDWDCGARSPNGQKGFTAVHSRHMKVEQDKGRPVHLYAVECLDPARSCHNMEALGNQTVGDGG